MNFKAYILFNLFLLLSIKGISQEVGSFNLEPEEELAPYLFKQPSSPEAAALGSFGVFPMSLANGTPDISIPLDAVGIDNKISIPITAKYHSGGIRVEQQSSSIGLGWALSAGGAITRSLNGQADESANGFLKHSFFALDYAFMEKLLEVDTDKDKVKGLMDNVSSGDYDIQPDKFIINALNLSGEFYFSNTGDIHISPYSGNVIIPKFSAGDIIGFEVRDEGGMIYYFGGSADFYERTTPSSSGVNPLSYISSWYLREVKNTNSSQSIYFNYKNHQINKADKKRKQIVVVDYVAPGYDGRPTTEESWVNYGGMTISSKIISSITGPNFNVTFNSSAAEEDHILKIDDIIITKGDKIKKVLFQYSIFGDVENRLKLESVVIKDKDTDDHKYSFEYFGGRLPSFDSFNQDHWGFYNGSGNSSLVPDITGIPELQEWDDDPYGGGADREPSFYSIITSSLKKIVYPTGGATEFIFSPNEYEVTIRGEKSSSSIVNLRSVGTGQSGIVQEYESFNTNFISEGSNHKFEITGNAAFNRGFDNENEPLKNSIGWVKLMKGEEEILFSNFLLEDRLTSSNATISIKNIILEDGVEYTLEVASNSQYSTVSAGIGYIYTKPPYQKLVEGKGIKLSEQKIYTKATDEEPSMIKRYEYEGGYDTSSDPKYYSKKWIYSKLPGSTTNDLFVKRMFYLKSNPIFLGDRTAQVGYTSVSEYYSDGHKGGKKITYYKKVLDERVSSSTSNTETELDYSLFPLKSNSAKRTMPYKVEDYKYVEGDYELIKKVSTIYTYNKLYNSYGVLIDKTIRFPTTGPANGLEKLNETYHISQFTLSNEVRQLTSESVQTFENGNEFINETLYEYADKITSLPSKTTKQISENDNIIIENYYPNHYLPSGFNSNCFDDFEQAIHDARSGLYSGDLITSLDNLNAYKSNFFQNIQGIYTNALNKVGYGNYNLYPSALEASVNHDLPTNITGSYAISLIESINSYYNARSQNNELLKTTISNTQNQEEKSGLQLYLKGRYSTVIEKKSFNNDHLVNHFIKKYNIDESNLVNTKVFVDKINRRYSNKEIEVFNVVERDIYGNVIESIENNSGIVSKYIWGYNGEYPIMVAVNSIGGKLYYEGFENNSNGSIYGNGAHEGEAFTLPSEFTLTTEEVSNHKMSYCFYKDDKWQVAVNKDFSRTIEEIGATKIDEVRIYPKDSQVSTFTYNPGVGVQSVTDHNMKASFYHYDNLGRLLFIKDHNGNILSSYDYEYLQK